MDMHVPVSGAPARRSARSALKDRLPFLLCLVPVAYCGGILLYGLWHFSDYATAWPQLLRYIAMPAVLCAAFLALARYGSWTSRVAVGGAACALLIVLFAYEARLEARWGAALGGLIDVPPHQWMIQSGLSHGLPPGKTAAALNEALGVRATRDAVLGGLPRENVLLCREQSDGLIYRADRFGFRNPESVYESPVDWMLVGDSFVEGVCLPENLDLVGQARASGRNVVGIGTRGSGPLQHLAMLKRFGPVIRPRHVVLVFYEGDDWEDLERETGYEWLRGVVSPKPDAGPAVMPAATVRAAHGVIDSWIAGDTPEMMKLLNDMNLLRNFFALHQTWTQIGLGYPRIAHRMPIYGEILAQARKTADGWGGKVALFYVPQSGRLVGMIPDTFVYDQLRNQVADAAARNKIQFIDLGTDFLGRRRRARFYSPDGHLTRRGATLAAPLLERALDPANTDLRELR